jgi:hypothetical protein
MDAITKMTGEEIIEYLCENIEPYEFEYDLNDHEDKLGKAELVDDVSETSGDAWLVQYFKDHNVYIRLNGFYNSYDASTEYEESDYDVVEPYQAVVTFYESAEEKEERAK